jgi:tyrosine-protein kinase Etk/Wzc
MGMTIKDAVQAETNATTAITRTLPHDWRRAGRPLPLPFHRATPPPVHDGRADRIDLMEAWLLLRNNWRAIAGIAAGVLAAVVLVTLASRMKFKARGSLYLGELQSATAAPSSVPDQLDFMGGRTGDVGTEIEILKSQDLVKRAVRSAGLNVTIAPKGWSAPRYLGWRLAHRDLNLLDLGSRHLIASNVVSAGGVKNLSVQFLGADAYEIWSPAQRLGNGKLGTPFKSPELELTLLSGPEGPPAPGSMYSMTVAPLDQVAEDFAKMVNVTIPKATGPTDPVKVVAVDFVDASPGAAAAFVDTLMHEYLDRRQSWKSEEASVAETFVIGQVGSIKAALDEAEKRLAEYRKSSNVVALGDESKGMIEQIGKYEQQRVAAQLQVASFGQIQGLLNKGTAPIEQYLVGETEDPVLANLSNNLATAQQELRRIEDRFTPDAPAAREQRAQVDGQLGMVKNYVLGRFNRAQRQLDSLNQMIGQFEEKLKTVPRAELDLAQLTRNTDVLSKEYSFLLERQQQAALTKASTISRNRILDPAVTPYREDSPAGGLRVVAGGLLGLLFGTLFVILRRLTSATYETDRELRRALAGLQILAAVPREDDGAHRAARRRTAGQVRAVGSFASDPRSAFSEAFRHLRTNIYYDANRTTEDKVLLITSPSPGDGKTLCALALAAAFASDDKRVLVIEADMHKPSQQGLSPQIGQSGLSSVLSWQSQWRDVIRCIRTRSGSFDAISAGPMPPTPAELLSSPQFAVLLEEARKRYDYILIDSPPYPLVSDALIMAMRVDRVLTILRPRNTRRRFVDEHLRRMSSLTTRYGIIINDGDELASVPGYGQSRTEPLSEMIATQAESTR